MDVSCASWLLHTQLTASQNVQRPFGRSLIESLFIESPHHFTSVVTATLSLSQSYVKIPAGTIVGCYMWVHTERHTGDPRVELFLDGVSCGGLVALGSGSGWAAY